MQLSVNGAAVRVATGGRDFDPKQPVLVFVHGAGCDHTIWQQQTRYFAHRGYAVLAPDLPAHGLSEGPPLASVGALADWLASLLDAAGAARATLIGHSLGAQVALEAAARDPDRVAALALLGVAARTPVHPELLDAAAANDHLSIDFFTAWGHGAYAHRGGNTAPGIWQIQATIRLQEEANPGVLSCDFMAADAYQGAVAAAGKVQCPTLFVLGAQDRMTPVKAANELIDAISGSSRIVLAHTGHMMMLESPDALRGALKEFLHDR
jgi:pimeloyl-ACP methyl ester carboxylesterase